MFPPFFCCPTSFSHSTRYYHFFNLFEHELLLIKDMETKWYDIREKSHHPAALSAEAVP